MWWVYLKEIRCLLRDKRTMLLNTLIPLVLGPGLLYFSFHASMQVTLTAPKISPVSVLRKDTKLARFLHEKGYPLISGQPYESLLKNETVLCHVEEQGNEIDIYYNPSSTKSTAVSELLKQYLADYGLQVTKQNMEQAGISIQLLFEPEIMTRPIETGQTASIIIMLFPLMVLSYGVMGVLNIAGDLGVGEKVKGTLEPLLSTGAKRSSLVTGKFFAISSMGIYSSLCAVLGLFFLSLLLKSSGFMSFSATLWMLLIVGLTSAFLAAVGLLLSIISRNFRESSTYTTLLSVLMGLPSIFSFNLNPYTVTRNQLHIPFYNVVCVIKELIVGMIQLEHLLLVLFWLLVYIGVFLCMTIRAFYDEKVLFKQ